MIHNIEGNFVWIKLVPKSQFWKIGTCAWFCWRTSHFSRNLTPQHLLYHSILRLSSYQGLYPNYLASLSREQRFSLYRNHSPLTLWRISAKLFEEVAVISPVKSITIICTELLWFSIGELAEKNFCWKPECWGRLKKNITEIHVKKKTNEWLKTLKMEQHVCSEVLAIHLFKVSWEMHMNAQL